MDTSVDVAALGVRLLREEYERQRVILRVEREEYDKRYTDALAKFARDNPSMIGVARRLFAQHQGWV